MDERVVRASELYEEAIFVRTPDALERADASLDEVEAELAVARGRILHGRFLAGEPEDPREEGLFDHAVTLFTAAGNTRALAEALFWKGCHLQVVRHDDARARPLLERSAELARTADDPLTLSYALRHLGIAEHGAGNLDSARELLEESVALRESLGFRAGVAANLVGLVYIAGAQGRSADARSLVARARAIAESDAPALLASIDEAGLFLE